MNIKLNIFLNLKQSNKIMCHCYYVSTIESCRHLEIFIYLRAFPSIQDGHNSCKGFNDNRNQINDHQSDRCIGQSSKPLKCQESRGSFFVQIIFESLFIFFKYANIKPYIISNYICTSPKNFKFVINLKLVIQKLIVKIYKQINHDDITNQKNEKPKFICKNTQYKYLTFKIVFTAKTAAYKIMSSFFACFKFFEGFFILTWFIIIEVCTFCLFNNNKLIT